MSLVSDTIERFIVDMLGEDNAVELRRNELAQYFNCAPSQINYVLTTRFTVERGYVITSKRGGGGYISIVRVSPASMSLREYVSEVVGDEISFTKACGFIANLQQSGILSCREAAMIQAACTDTALVQPNIKDYIRALTLKNMLSTLY